MSAIGPRRTFVFASRNTVGKAEKEKPAHVEHNSAECRPHTTNPQLAQAIVRAHSWRKSLTDGTYNSIEDLAHPAGHHPKVVRNNIRLAYLAPNVIRAILQGNQSTSMTVRQLSQLGVLSWREQQRRLQTGM